MSQEFKVRFLVQKRANEYEKPYEKQTIVKKIFAEDDKKALEKAESIAESRTTNKERWSVRAIEQI